MYELSVSPYPLSADSGFTVATYDTSAIVVGLDTSIYYYAWLRTSCPHECPSHDTVIWSKWSSPLLFCSGANAPDTTAPEYPDDTTAAVCNADLLQRHVSVSPNPAGDRVEVLSNFGLTEIEVYDEQGHLQQTLKTTGLKAALATAAWPRGTYYLRIHTPPWAPPQRN